MKIGFTVSIIGTIILILGIIFYLQGLSIVGPESSFMYSNPEWITYGFEIIIVGIIIIGVGSGIKIIKKS
ncbi:MAG: hypothetical protein COA77_06340 [Thaumarchaeota archaeon]|nr:MAG: hypothetical protein COA77_06340 [Nitrososphaerota archaeon]